MSISQNMTSTTKENSTPKKVTLVGNPNVGKSIIFNYLTKIYVEVSNFPGTTVEVCSGRHKDYLVYDTPGIYSVASFNDEERVAKDIILEADTIINVIDAAHLERDLFLTFQLIEMGKPIVVALNMYDELDKNGISLNVEKLSQILGVPVVPTIAPLRKGFKKLEGLIPLATKGNYTPDIKKELSEFISTDIAEHDKLLLIESDEPTFLKYKDKDFKIKSDREKMYLLRRLHVNKIIEDVIVFKKSSKNIGKKFGRMSINPITGIPIAMIILYVVYLFIGIFVADILVGFTEGYIGNEVYEYNIKRIVAKNNDVEIILITKNESNEVIKKEATYFQNGINSNLPLFNFLATQKEETNSNLQFNYSNKVLALLFGEFGVLTMTVTYVIFLLFPLVVGFYFMLSFLEDTGYLPRLAALVDKLLNYVGLNGRAVIPIIVGFGCVTMATITTRILSSNRERTITTTILQLAIPCSAQLGVIAMLLASAKVEITIIYIIIIFLFLAILGTLLNKFLKGESTPLMIDLPQIRLPRIKNIIQKTEYRAFAFMKEALPWFFFGALFISILQVTGALKATINFLYPVVVVWLKLPAETAVAFVMGLVRRDFGAAGLGNLPLNEYQILVSIIVLTLFVPCVTSLIIMFKERGARQGIVIWVGSLVLAFFVGGIVAQIVL
jgi:ferrous iron transport protein B